MCVFSLSLSSFSLRLSAFYHDSHSVFGFRECASGSCCDEIMRRDVVIQQFRPKGHICSLSFPLYICRRVSLPLSTLTFYNTLCIFWVCTLQFLPSIYHLYCISAHQRRLFWHVAFLIWLMVEGFVGLTAYQLDWWAGVDVNVTQLPCGHSLSFNWLVFKRILLFQQVATFEIASQKWWRYKHTFNLLFIQHQWLLNSALFPQIDWEA